MLAPPPAQTAKVATGNNEAEFGHATASVGDGGRDNAEPRGAAVLRVVR